MAPRRTPASEQRAAGGNEPSPATRTEEPTPETSTNDGPPAGQQRMDPDELASLSAQEVEALFAATVQEARKRKQIEQILAMRNGADVDDVLNQRAATPPQPEPKRQKGDAWMKQLAPIRFKGGNWTDVSDFLFKLQGRFSLSKDDFDTDQTKVLYAGGCLEGIASRRWMNHVANNYNNDVDRVTWAAMERWLRNSVADADTRAYSALIELNEKRQKPGQSYQQFIDQYEAIEAECPDRQPERTRVINVVSRLLPELQNKVMANGLPASREELDNVAKRAEATQKIQNRETRLSTQPPSISRDHRGGSRWPPARPFMEPPRESPEGAVQSTTERSRSTTESSSAPTAVKREESTASRGPPTGDRSHVKCFNCGKMGHYSDQCREPNCHNCGQPRHSGQRCQIRNTATGVNAIQLP
ncbi:hypothetical protein CPLU01_04211 [Colletotrichum plurivorum]|uniref:CCHC-type domain-containing protein n=1 Tax=Colletotrichum plurivorum TaxID=2175906 RepID=A0A8H6NK38_9PEZI|nr:hypothetical protein CPLU01_04211 [Colletotrichum plurivorum]